MDFRIRILDVVSHWNESEQIEELLEPCCHDIVSARSATDALQLASRSSYDVFVVDAARADSAVVQMCRDLKAISSETPLIVYSGEVSERERAELLATGASLIHRPAEAWEFEAQFAKLVKRPRQLLSRTAVS
jgi:DNA-binding response OmpR family regulator